MKTSHPNDEILQRLEDVELRLLQSIWSLESALLELIKSQQDLEIRVDRLNQKTKLSSAR